jgi:hypothetical protein
LLNKTQGIDLKTSLGSSFQDRSIMTSDSDSDSESLRDSIGKLVEGLNMDRNSGKISVSYDFSHFDRDEDSELKFL